MNKNIRHIIDLERVNALLEAFNKTTGFVTAILDLEGNVISKSGWRQICTEFHRKNPETLKRCIISDTELANKVGKGEKYLAYKCMNGLMDVVVPLKINGEHVANLFSGQFFFQKPDIAFFKKQAAAFGFDEKKYLDMLSNVPVVSEEKVKTAMDFLINMTGFISELAIQKLEQAELNQDLIDSKHRFFVLFQKSAFPIVLLKLPEGRLVEINEAFEREFGFSKQELLGKTSVEAGINLDAEMRDQIYKTLNEVGFVRNQEMIFTSKSGEKNYYRSNIDKVIIDGEEYLLNSAQNISEYKKAQNKLKDNYDLIRIGGEKVKLGGWNVILKENRLYWSDEVAAIHEMPAAYAPLIEESINFYAPEWRDKITEVFGQCIKEGIPYDEEMEIITASGKRVWVRTIGEAVRDDNGNIVKIQGALQDISLQKQAEKELKNSEAGYKAIFESAGTATLIVDEDTSILMANSECLEMFGYDKAQLTGEKWTKFVDPESLQEMLNNHQLRRHKPNMVLRKYDVKLLNYKGEKRDVVLNVNMIPGTKQSVVSMLDITENKQAEKLNRKTAERAEMQRNLIAQLTFEDSVVNNRIDDALKIVSTKLAATLQVDRVSVWLLSDDEKKLKRRILFDVNSGLVSHIEELNFADNPSYFKALRNDSQIDAEDAQNDWRTKELADNYFIPLQISSLLDSVIQQDGRLIGIVCAEHRGPLRKWHADEKSFLSAITNLVAQLFANAERKRAEHEILKLSRAIEQSRNSVIITDLEGNIEYVNPKTLEITGYTKEELVGNNPRIFNSGEMTKEEYQHLWSSLLSGKEWTGQFHNKNKNGKLYWESASISPIFNEKQEAINYVAVKEDITERKRLEDAQKLVLEISQLVSKHVSLKSFLSEVHHKIKQIVRAENFYVALYNEEDNTYSFPYHVDEFDKVELNKAYNFNKSYTDHVLKSNQSLIITPKDKLVIETDGSIKGYGDELSVWLGVPFKTAKAIKPNGVIAIQDYNTLTSYTDTDKASIEIIAHSIGHFIERIKYVEELIAAKEKAEESDRLKSAFLANMSHEIRTPMNGILGFTDLLLEPDLSSDEKEYFINIVQQSGQRMLNTVNNIVTISKIEAGLVSASTIETDFNKRIKELVDFFKPEAEKKGLDLIVDMLLPFSEKDIITDQIKLDSILTNLIKNAIKYTESGKINVGCQTDGTVVEFYVKDTGIGIPIDRIEAIFNRFEQADISDTRAFEGSGLGLAIAKSYVEMLDGKIHVKSVEGKGSTFYFTLPAKRKNERKPTEHTEELSFNKKKNFGLEKLKILIVEDDEASRNYLSLIVKDLSDQLFITKTGREAIEICRDNKAIDLILMDIKMPEMNGYEATRRIRGFNADVIIIAQTAISLSADREKAIESGCNDYISKPIKKNELLMLIQKYFEKKIIK
ncbi:MAG: PAS domain S-box protein [Bacteroidales bacterium]|jgi:PAS domain S-box-containing protein|nr:PAS domain S-box protein [Bacteroidales bacterium]